MTIKVLDEKTGADKSMFNVLRGETFLWQGKLFICFHKSAYDGIFAICLSDNGKEYRFTRDQPVTIVDIEVKIVN